MWRPIFKWDFISAVSDPVGLFFVLSSHIWNQYVMYWAVMCSEYFFSVFKYFLKRLHLNAKIMHICYTHIYKNSRHVTDCGDGGFASFCLNAENICFIQTIFLSLDKSRLAVSTLEFLKIASAVMYLSTIHTFESLCHKWIICNYL